MKKKEEAKYFDKEWMEMSARLKAFLEINNQEDLHKFRVQIKKLRAMLSLIESTSGRRGLMKDFKPVKNIFKSAGYIREAHINLQLGERYNLKNEAFELSQQKIIEDGINEFRIKGKEFIKNLKNVHKGLKKQLPKINNSSIAGYYKRQLEQIGGKLVVTGFTEEMHTNRKLIKNLVYNHKLADKPLKGSFYLNAEYLDKLQEAIGKWHDNIVAVQLFSSPGLNDKHIVVRIKRRNLAVKRNITQLADDFLKKATCALPLSIN